MSTKALASAIYVGTVRHRRMEGRGHAFTFPLFMAYLDLSELDAVLGMTRWWSRSRWSPVRFVREDYLGPRERPLDEAVRARVERELGWRPAGPIRMLTNLRQFGYVFNPVTFYYCFDASGERVEAIVAEITNTPWKERHAYVLDRREAGRSGAEVSEVVGSGEGSVGGGGAPADRGVLRWRFRKVFHVSPLFPMEIDYDWAFGAPGERLGVHMNLSAAGAGGAGGVSDEPRAISVEEDAAGRVPRLFDATLSLRRREMTAGSMRAQVLAFPLLTLRIIGRIHWEFLLTWLKGARIYNHPHGRDGRPAKAPAAGVRASAVASVLPASSRGGT